MWHHVPIKLGPHLCRIKDIPRNRQEKELFLIDEQYNEHLVGNGVVQAMPKVGLHQAVYSVSRSLAPPYKETEFHQAHIGAWLSQFLGQPVDASKPPFDLEKGVASMSSRQQFGSVDAEHGPAVSLPLLDDQPPDAVPSHQLRHGKSSSIHEQSSPEVSLSLSTCTTTSTVDRCEEAVTGGGKRTRTVDGDTAVSSAGAGAFYACSEEVPVSKRTRTNALRNGVSPCSLAAAAERLAAVEYGDRDARCADMKTGAASAGSLTYTEHECVFRSLRILVSSIQSHSTQ